MIEYLIVYGIQFYYIIIRLASPLGLTVEYEVYRK